MHSFRTNAEAGGLISYDRNGCRLELVREFAPKATDVAMLVNPLSPDAPPEIRDVQAAAQANGFIATLADHRSSALLVGADPFFMVRREQIVALIAQQKVPTVYPFREFADAGGLMIHGGAWLRGEAKDYAFPAELFVNAGVNYT